MQGQTGPQGPPGAAAWATIAPGALGAILLDSQNLTVHQDGNGVFTLTVGSCVSGPPAEVVTPLTYGVATNGIPVAYVVTQNGPSNVFKVVTGGISKSGSFSQENGTFSVAVFCKHS
jgi:hypothetical protein